MRISTEKVNWWVASGELLLIVIGILMALAIDSCTERRADELMANAYLHDLAEELEVDAQKLAQSHARIVLMIDSASQLLRVLESDVDQHPDPGGLLLNSLIGEDLIRQPVIWQELQMTGSLRLIAEPAIRTAIVSHYLDRAARFKIVEENFVPAMRDLRALAWDILPIESYAQFFQTGHSGVPAAAIAMGFESREDATFLLKRMIVTARVANRKLESAAVSTAELLAVLGVPSEPSIN